MKFEFENYEFAVNIEEKVIFGVSDNGDKIRWDYSKKYLPGVMSNGKILENEIDREKARVLIYRAFNSNDIDTHIIEKGYFENKKDTLFLDKNNGVWLCGYYGNSSKDNKIQTLWIKGRIGNSAFVWKPYEYRDTAVAVSSLFSNIETGNILYVDKIIERIKVQYNTLVDFEKAIRAAKPDMTKYDGFFEGFISSQNKNVESPKTKINEELVSNRVNKVDEDKTIINIKSIKSNANFSIEDQAF